MDIAPKSYILPFDGVAGSTPSVTIMTDGVLVSTPTAPIVDLGSGHFTIDLSAYAAFSNVQALITFAGYKPFPVGWCKEAVDLAALSDEIDAIKTKTDCIPVIPASQTDVDTYVYNAKVELLTAISNKPVTPATDITGLVAQAEAIKAGVDALNNHGSGDTLYSYPVTDAEGNPADNIYVECYGDAAYTKRRGYGYTPSSGIINFMLTVPNPDAPAEHPNRYYFRITNNNVSYDDYEDVA